MRLVPSVSVVLVGLLVGGCASIYRAIGIGTEARTYSGALYAASAPTTYVPVRITSTSATAFHFVRMDIFMSRGRTEQERRSAVEGTRSYGPLSVGQTVRLYAGATYLVVPTCRSAVNWRKQQMIVAPWEPGEIRINC